MKGTRNSQPVSRLLVRGVNWLGDAVMTTPALLRLRARFPAAHITVLTPDKLRDLWKGHPAVDEVVAFAAGEGLLSVSRKLREAEFDTALVLPNSPRSALEIWLARIPQRVGYARPWRNWLLTQAIRPRPGQVTMRKRSVAEIKQLLAPGIAHHASRIPASASAHQIHEYLHLAAALGASPEPIPPRLTVSAAEVAAVRERFSLPSDACPIFGLNPGAEYGPAKRWPAERFIAAAREVHKRTKCLWLILGGKNDEPIAREIASAIRLTPDSPHLAPRALAGQTSLRELLAVLSHCRVLLTNDSGPMHVAAALGVPVVVPFGSTAPELTGPGLPGDLRHRPLQSDAPCAPCFRRECPIDLRCLHGLSIERVVQALLEVARATPAIQGVTEP